MNVIVLNHDPSRWATSRKYLHQLGVEPVRFPAYTHGDKRRAICISYRRLLQTVTEPAIVLQDDMFPARIPAVEGFVVHNRPLNSRHICPRMFTITPELAPLLADRFNVALWACRLMPELVEQYGSVGEPLVNT